MTNNRINYALVGFFVLVTLVTLITTIAVLTGRTGAVSTYYTT